MGNLPVGMGFNEKMLQEFFSTTITGLGIQTPQPVSSVWLSSEGTFCVRTVQMLAGAFS